MSRIALLTPTYHRDYQHFCVLRESLDAAGCDWPHWVVVQTEDLPLFRRRQWGPQVRLLATAEILPSDVEAARRRVASYPHVWAKARRSLNKRFGWFADASLDGWNTQQLIKLGLASSAEADCWVTLDSDVVICGAVRETDFLRGTEVALYSQPSNSHIAFQQKWCGEARTLLGLPPSDREYNYIAHPFSFSTPVVKALLAELERRHAAPWQQVLGGLRANSLSEFLLYGLFAREVWGLRGLFEMPANARTHWIHKTDQPELERGSAAERTVRECFANPDLDYLVIQSARNQPLEPLLPCLRQCIARR
jgi:hypothetical protein